ncbi:unnamed protein product [Effrenium voratum]|nr:unnamed protein product [Effrenium voratum]CAJ1460794.1 unnamed protein product [Effrenium voratum]
MAAAALRVASGWLPPAARAVARMGALPDCQMCRQASLCQDTLGYAMEQLLPSAQVEALSPRGFESRLLQLAPLLQDLQQLCAVSQWANRINAGGWSATHEYLFQEPGTKGDLRRRYADSMRLFLVKAWFCRAHAPEGLAAHVVGR